MGCFPCFESSQEDNNFNHQRSAMKSTHPIFPDYLPVTQFSGFIVAIGIALGVLITGPISGGSMNPARSLGPAIVSYNYQGLWIYLTAPTLGAICGAFMLRMLKPCGSLTSSSSSTSQRSQFLQID